MLNILCIFNNGMKMDLLQSQILGLFEFLEKLDLNQYLGSIQYHILQESHMLIGIYHQGYILNLL